jgi:hypothetical protein
VFLNNAVWVVSLMLVEFSASPKAIRAYVGAGCLTDRVGASYSDIIRKLSEAAIAFYEETGFIADRLEHCTANHQSPHGRGGRNRSAQSASSEEVGFTLLRIVMIFLAEVQLANDWPPPYT